MARDWCGRMVLGSWRQASTAAWASSMLADVEQFQLQGLVQPLEHHLGRAGLPEPVGELPAVAGEDFEGDSVLRHRGGER